MTKLEIRHIVEETIRQIVLSGTIHPMEVNRCSMNFAQREEACEGLLLEEDILSLQKEGVSRLQIKKGCILTPLARDKAVQFKMQIVEEEG